MVSCSITLKVGGGWFGGEGLVGREDRDTGSQIFLGRRDPSESKSNRGRVSIIADPTYDGCVGWP